MAYATATRGTVLPSGLDARPAPATMPNFGNGAPAPNSAPVAPALPAPGTGTTATTPPPSGLYADLLNEFPWLKTIGLDPSWFQNIAATTTNDAEAVAQLRQTSQYKARFQGIYRDDGSLRMTEAQYIATEDTYRQLLSQYGIDTKHMDNPADYVGFFQSDIDPNELKQRLDTFTQIKDSSQNTKDAFYVYANMRVSDDELYAAAVDPAAAQRLTDEYNQKVAAQPLDYQTWITRATQAGLSRVVTTLTQLQNVGAVTGTAVTSITNIDPTFARDIMDALYHGGDPTSGQTLDLNSLLTAFEEAGLGAAATNSGLTLPDKARIQELRTAGITKAQAAQAYSQFAGQQGVYAGAVQRLTQANRSFTQSDFEQAALLNNGQQADVLTRAMKQEDAYGQASGAFGFSQAKRGTFAQSGLATPF